MRAERKNKVTSRRFGHLPTLAASLALWWLILQIPLFDGVSYAMVRYAEFIQPVVTLLVG